MACCTLKEDIRVWPKLFLLATSCFPSLLQHSLQHMLVPKGFKEQQGVAAVAAQTASYTSMLSSAFSMPSSSASYVLCRPEVGRQMF